MSTPSIFGHRWILVLRAKICQSDRTIPLYSIRKPRSSSVLLSHKSISLSSLCPMHRSAWGEIAAIRGLQGAVRYTYEIINSACVIIPIKNLAGLIRQPFITEIWPDSKGNLQLSQSVQDIGADKVHNAPPNGLGVTGKGRHCCCC